jgi:hypothetical protein
MRKQCQREIVMSAQLLSPGRRITLARSAAVFLAVSAVAVAYSMSAPDKYTLKVPNGLAFSEFKGYEDWPVIAISENGGLISVILGNREMIDAFRAGAPGNGKSFPDGARMAKIHWNPKKNEAYPGQPTVPNTIHDIDFMVKDGKRFADSGGWGYGEFEYESSSDTFRPGTLTDKPAQANDAKCGFACHTLVKTRDYVFTDYGKR